MSGARNARSVSIDFDECYVLTQQSAIASLQKEDLANKIEIMRLKQIIDTQNRTIHEHLNEKSSLKLNWQDETLLLPKNQHDEILLQRKRLLADMLLQHKRLYLHLKLCDHLVIFSRHVNH
jgi:hypothetical protein